MPIYEYQCTSCGHKFEILQKMSDSSTQNCPKCAAKAEKLLSPSAFVLKGSGFYVNDYPSEDRKKALKEEPGEHKKSDSKPAVAANSEKSSSIQSGSENSSQVTKKENNQESASKAA